jgi:Rieske 2Fe-2S family protein
MATAERFVPFRRTVEAPTTALPQPYFTSPAWHQRDIELVFKRQWLFVGHGSQIAKPGDYFTYQLDKDNVVIARNADGTIHAFHNSCRHRGSRICTEASGNAKVFICPVHSWVYGLDGKLKVTPKMDVDKTQYPAIAVRVEEWHGMIFINFAEDEPRSVAERLKRTDLDHFNLGHTKVIYDRKYILKANWKFSAETFIECYHCAPNHPTLMKLMDPLKGMEAWDPRKATDDLVIYSGDISCDFLQPNFKSFTADGEFKCKKPLGDGVNWRPEIAGLGWYPQFGMFASPDHAYTMSWKPIAAGLSEFRSTWMVHEDAVEGVDYNIDEVVALGDLINEEDKRVCENYQIGVESSGYRPGPYHPVFEGPVRAFNYLYLRQVGTDPYLTGE